MDINGFKLHLEERKLKSERIQKFVDVIKKYDELYNLSPKNEDILAYSEHLVEEGLNEFDSYFAMMSYGKYAGIDSLYVTALELIDGIEAMGNLHRKLSEEESEELRDEIFSGIEIPPVGTPLFKLPVITQKVLERMDEKLGEERIKELLGDCLRDLEDSWFMDGREKYQNAESLDKFLKIKSDGLIKDLTRIKEENDLFFTQPITQDVLDFLKDNPHMGRGIRKGNTIMHTKIPFIAVEYITEQDEDLKRYYYCHCPWARESLVQDDVEVSGLFCNCSAGFHKKEWEVILERPLKAEVVESVLDGDLQCTIAIHLPDDIK